MALGASRGYESATHKVLNPVHFLSPLVRSGCTHVVEGSLKMSLISCAQVFMRLSVLVFDLLVFFPGVWLVAMEVSDALPDPIHNRKLVVAGET